MNGRLTGKAGVCLATLGPGATNLVTAAAYAQLGAMPLLVVTGQKPIKSSKQGRFQIVDVVQMMQPLTKYTHQIASGDNIPSRIREAFRLVEEERPGAAHLEFPEDIAIEETTLTTLAKSMTRRAIAEGNAVQTAVEMIEAAKHPLLLIGAGANRKSTSNILSRFIDATGIPFFSTQMGKGVVDERHPLFLGNAALSADDFLHRAIDSADLIINVGHDVVEKPPFFMKHGGFKVIHINFSSATVDPVYFPQWEVVGDIANSIWQIKEALTPQNAWDFSRFMQIKEHVEEHLKLCMDSPSFPVCPPRLVRDVRRVMPSDGIIALDNGVYKFLNY
jgi:acetolactate synthase I/II/III large subunit